MRKRSFHSSSLVFRTSKLVQTPAYPKAGFASSPISPPNFGGDKERTQRDKNQFCPGKLVAPLLRGSLCHPPALRGGRGLGRALLVSRRPAGLLKTSPGGSASCSARGGGEKASLWAAKAGITSGFEGQKPVALLGPSQKLVRQGG